MSLLVFVLVALSASLHVLWNTLVKTSGDKASFAWLTSMVSLAVLIPIVAGYGWFHPLGLTWPALGWAALSGLFEALYTIFLFRAYFYADLSLVYPLSRGLAPAATMLLGGILLGDHVTSGQSVAVLIVIAGVLLVGWSASRGGLKNVKPMGIFMAAATACMIAGYHMADRKAMILADPPSPLAYLFLIHLFMAVFIGVWALGILKPGKAIWSEWSANRWSVIWVGVLTPLSYYLIILALRLGNVTFVTAGRNLGIFISTLVGAFILKERVTFVRILGAIVILAGMTLLVVMN